MGSKREAKKLHMASQSEGRLSTRPDLEPTAWEDEERGGQETQSDKVADSTKEWIHRWQPEGTVQDSCCWQGIINAYTPGALPSATAGRPSLASPP